MTFDELISLTGMTLDAKLEGYAEDVNNGKPNWPHFAWTCTLNLAGRTLTTPYKLGVAHCTRAAFHAQSGTRSAHDAWEACTRIRGEIRRLMGKHYQAFMACEES